MFVSYVHFLEVPALFLFFKLVIDGLLTMEAHHFVLFGYGMYHEVCSLILFAGSSLPRLRVRLAHGETAHGVGGELRYAHVVERVGV